jgi:KDO2-lipid IV(A) lauroyltransferase
MHAYNANPPLNKPLTPLRKRLKRAVRYALIRLSIALLQRLPANWVGGLGARFGSLAFALAGGERRKALESLERAFGEKAEAERRLIARECFRHLGRSLFELVCVEQIDHEVERWVRWPAEDRAVLDAALARKRGVVFVSGHCGSWELLARRVALAGYPCQTIAKETTDPKTTALVERFRAASKLKSIWRGQPGAAKAMLRALKAGEILGLLIDQDTDVQSVWVPFFGHLAKTPRAAADLALRTGAAVVMGFCRREVDGRYRISMREVPTAPLDALALTEQMTLHIESAIRASPEQWVWMHRRWKSAPPTAS